MSFLTDIRTQFTSKPRFPTISFKSYMLIIAGSNTGIGKEAAEHFVRLGASKVILAVRSISKGLAAAAEIEASTTHIGIIGVRKCDYSKYESLRQFVEKVKGLERVDGIGIVLNAGIATSRFGRMERGGEYDCCQCCWDDVLDCGDGAGFEGECEDVGDGTCG